MRYELPRYIEQEAKIAGPFTIKQFFILFGAGIICAMLFFLLKPGLAIFFSSIIVGLTLFMIFGKYKGRPISAIITGMMKYFWSPRTYIWQKQTINPKDVYRETEKKTEQQTNPEEPIQKTVSKEDLKNIARQLDKK